MIIFKSLSGAGNFLISNLVIGNGKSLIKVKQLLEILLLEHYLMNHLIF